MVKAPPAGRSAGTQPTLSRFFAPAGGALSAKKSPQDKHAALPSPRKSPLSGTARADSTSPVAVASAITVSPVTALPPTPAESESKPLRASAVNSRKRTSHALRDGTGSSEEGERADSRAHAKRRRRTEEAGDTSNKPTPARTKRPRAADCAESSDDGVKNTAPPAKKRPSAPRKRAVVSESEGDGDDDDTSPGLARIRAVFASSDAVQSDAKSATKESKDKGKARASVESFAYAGDGEPHEVSDGPAEGRRRRLISKRMLGIEMGGRAPTEDDAAVAAAGDGEGAARDPREALPTGAKLSQLTPLEQQFVAVKRRYPDAVLFVECGYKYRFFGQDAQIAAKELNIMSFWNHNFLTASIPTHRLPVHVKRLVNLGYKVGVVRQTETAALKAAGDTKSKPFTRELKALYTKATLVGEDVDALDDAEAQGGLPQSTYLMCLREERAKAGDNARISFVAVRPATGDIVYDEFEDEVSRSELETRLVHMQPSEMLLPATLSPRTERLIANMAVKWGNDEGMRLERLTDDHFEQSGAFSRLTEFYTAGNAGPTALETITRLPAGVVSCLSALVGHLREFGLESALRLTANISPFAARNAMSIGGTAAVNLELFRNATDGGEKGSLYAVLNHAVTPFGRRLLRRWVSAPLTDKRAIEERLDAVEALANCEAQFLADIRTTMSRLTDLDRGLCRIYYCKCSPQEFLAIVKSFERVAELFGASSSLALEAFTSSTLLRALFADIPRQAALVAPFLRDIDAEAARSGRKADMFRRDEELYPQIPSTKRDIARVMKGINAHLADVRRTLRNSSLEYVTVSNVEFLIEVKVANLAAVPADWMKMSATKAVARFHTPHIVAATKELQQLRERLEIEASAAWTKFLGQFSGMYDELRCAIRGLATLDCLMSLAAVARMPGYVRPQIVGEAEGPASVTVTAGRHPMVDAMITQGQFVPNDVHLSGDGERCMVITGPNMGGKSCYMRQVALLAIMAQMGSFVPAEAASVGVVDAVYTRMGASDNINKGASTFMVELQEASEIIRSASARSLVILDELGRGTSTHDGVAIAYATLHHIVAQTKCLALFVTHYPSIASLEAVFPAVVGNYHMAFMDDSPGTKEESITFLYQLTRGVAARSFGLNVARLANIPVDVVERASCKSHEMERTARSRGGIDGLQMYLLHELRVLLRGEAQDGDGERRVSHALAQIRRLYSV